MNTFIYIKSFKEEVPVRNALINEAIRVGIFPPSDKERDHYGIIDTDNPGDFEIQFLKDYQECRSVLQVHRSRSLFLFSYSDPYDKTPISGVKIISYANPKLENNYFMFGYVWPRELDQTLFTKFLDNFGYFQKFSTNYSKKFQEQFLIDFALKNEGKTMDIFMKAADKEFCIFQIGRGAKCIEKIFFGSNGGRMETKKSAKFLTVSVGGFMHAQTMKASAGLGGEVFYVEPFYDTLVKSHILLTDKPGTTSQSTDFIKQVETFDKEGDLVVCKRIDDIYKSHSRQLGFRTNAIVPFRPTEYVSEHIHQTPPRSTSFYREPLDKTESKLITLKIKE